MPVRPSEPPVGFGLVLYRWPCVGLSLLLSWVNVEINLTSVRNNVSACSIWIRFCCRGRIWGSNKAGDERRGARRGSVQSKQHILCFFSTLLIIPRVRDGVRDGIKLLVLWLNCCEQSFQVLQEHRNKRLESLRPSNMRPCQFNELKRRLTYFTFCILPAICEWLRMTMSRAYWWLKSEGEFSMFGKVDLSGGLYDTLTLFNKLSTTESSKWEVTAGEWINRWKGERCHCLTLYLLNALWDGMQKGAPYIH